MPYDIIPSLSVLAAFSAVSLVVIFTPGPDMTYFMSRTLSHGRIGGTAAFAGALMGLLAHTVLAGLGLSVLLTTSATAFTVLKIAGALYLLYLAVQAVRKGSSFALAVNGRKAGLREVFMSGLAINLLNPKIVLFFVTFLPQFVDAHDPHAAGKLIFLGLYFIAISVPLCGLLILLADRVADRLRQSPRILRVIDWLMAGIFGAFAVRLLAARS